MERLKEIVVRYEGMTDLFLLCVDRDGQLGRNDRLRQIEREFGDHRFIAQSAHEELETWALAGLDLPVEWRWQEVRADISVKERYFEPLADSRGVRDGPGGGRKAIGEEASKRIQAIRQRCPDDFDDFAKRIATFIR